MRDILRVDADTRVLHRDENLVSDVLVRSDQKVAGSIHDSQHSFYSIHHEIDDHLLQLDPITEHRGQRGG